MGANQVALLQTVDITEPGEYSVTVAGDNLSLETYDLQVVRNAAVEVEVVSDIDASATQNRCCLPFQWFVEKGLKVNCLKSFVGLDF